MDASKIMMAHVATEIIVIGGISFFFHKRISELNTKIAELEKKLEKCEGCTGTAEGGITGEQFGQFQQQTTQHINNIYSAIRQIANTINGGVPPPPETASPQQPNKTQMKEKMREAQQQMKEAQMKESDEEEAERKAAEDIKRTEMKPVGREKKEEESRMAEESRRKIKEEIAKRDDEQVLDDLPSKESLLSLAKELAKPQKEIARCLGLLP